MLLFRKKPKDVISVTIDLCDDYFVVNGKQFTIPAKVSELVEILGEPRCVADRNKDDKTYKEIVCEKYNLSPEKFSMMDYYWDDLGLMASTYEKKTVSCFWIKIDNSRKYPMEMAKHNFSGTLFINGRPWQDVVEERKGNGTFYMKLGKLHAYVVRHGVKPKGVKQFQVSLNDGEQFEFFD